MPFIGERWNQQFTVSGMTWLIQPLSLYLVFLVTLYNLLIFYYRFARVELNFFACKIYDVSKLIDKLRNKCNRMWRPGFYFQNPDLFLCFQTQPKNLLGFDILAGHILGCIEKTAQPFPRNLIKEIENASEILDHLTRLADFDAVSLRKNATKLAEYWIKEIDDLCSFFGKFSSLLNVADFGPLVNPIILKKQYQVYKIYFFEQRRQ